MAINVGAASYEVRFDPGNTNIDITKFVVAIDSMTDVGTGEVNSATLTLDGNDGSFVENTHSATTPILDQWTKIKITVTDKNTNSYSRIFEVDTTMPQKAIGGGNLMKVEMLGQEHNLQKVHFAKQYFFADANSTAEDIMGRYNAPGGKGDDQVTIEDHDDITKNKLPVCPNDALDIC